MLTRYSPVRHFPQLPLDESSFHWFSFDLHVLSTPPAFILSQDQTLNKMVSKQPHSCPNHFIEVSFLNFKDKKSTSPFILMKDSCVLLVLRVCSLFNLQGAMPSPAQSVSKLFSVGGASLYHQSSCLSSPFFNFLKISFEPASGLHPSARSRELCYLTTARPLCQELFRLPANFFS